MKTEDTKAHRRGRLMGAAINNTVDLMYQNNTARNYLDGVIDLLAGELQKRGGVRQWKRVER